jgi:hypothetical protein
MLQIYGFASEFLKKLAPARGRVRFAVSLDDDMKICDMGGSRDRVRLWVYPEEL